LNSEVVDELDIEILENYVIVHQADATFVETLPFHQIKNEFHHFDLVNFSTGPYRPVLNVR